MPTTRLLLVTEIWDGKPSHRKSLARNLLVWSDLTFGPLLQGQMRTAKLKSAYNSFIIKRPARDACLCMGELQAPPAPPAPAAPPAPPAPHFVFLITL